MNPPEPPAANVALYGTKVVPRVRELLGAASLG